MNQGLKALWQGEDAGFCVILYGNTYLDHIRLGIILDERAIQNHKRLFQISLELDFTLSY